MDKGFAGVVAVAILGCAVILAIAFQISEGLAMQREAGGANQATGSAMGGVARRDSALMGGARERVQAAEAARDAAALWESGTGGTTAVEQDARDLTTAHDLEISPPRAGVSATTEPGIRPLARQRTPVAAAEINPAEGHTVSPRTADEKGERPRQGRRRDSSEAEIPPMTASDPEPSREPGRAGGDGLPGVTAGETAPAIEMIRGTRRSSEAVAATEDKATDDKD